VIDEPGPWGTGPFTLVQGASSILTRNVVMDQDPYTAAWIIESEDRTPQVVLEANLSHWNREARGPRIHRAVFRNDLSPAEALDKCLDGDGEVDIVAEVGSDDADRVKASEYARLVSINANRNLSCIINRGATDVPLHDVNIRKALNMAVDRKRLVDDGFHGYATPLPAFTPDWCAGFPAGAAPYPHDPAQARSLWAEGDWPAGRPVRIAATGSFVGVADMLAADIREALRVDVDVITIGDDEVIPGTRRLMEKKLEQGWDLLVHAWFDLSSEAPPAAVHREFFGRDGAFRAGPVDEGFDALFAEMAAQLDSDRLVEVAERIDQYCFDNALALFLCAPQALYAVNNHVEFGPYRTTFEVAEVTVGEGHWSRQEGSSGWPSGSERSAAAPSKREEWQHRPGFSGASGNAC